MLNSWPSTFPELFRSHRESVRVRSYQPCFELEPHTHEEIQLTMLLAGSLEEWSAGRRFESGPLDVVIKPAQVLHTNRFGPHGTLTLQVSLPSDAGDVLQTSGIPLDRVTWQSNQTATRLFLQAVVAKSATRRPTAGQLADLAYSQESLGSRCAPNWAQALWRQLPRRYAAPLTVRKLAQEAGVHPVHLARTVRRHYGVSVTDRLRQLRVAAAAGMLSQADTALTSVATDCGFADQSHLCRVFKSYTSLTPLEFRRLATSS